MLSGEYLREVVSFNICSFLCTYNLFLFATQCKKLKIGREDQQNIEDLLEDGQNKFW